MKNIIYFFALLALAGCATNHKNHYQASLDNYRAVNEQNMLSGKMLKSEYYKGIYDIYNRSNFVDKGINMKLLASLIGISLDQEADVISTEKFETLKMKYIAEFEIDRASLAPTAQNYQPYVYIPTRQAPPPKLQSSKTCTSTVSGNNVYTTCN